KGEPGERGGEAGDLIVHVFVKNEGMPKASGGKGDLLVKVEVVVPQNIQGKAKDLLEEYAREVTHDNPRAEIIALNARRKR
ncbi:MAG: hypothetical protein ACKOMW_06740, partial [Actinomycetes bacterium]